MPKKKKKTNISDSKNVLFCSNFNDRTKTSIFSFKKTAMKQQMNLFVSCFHLDHGETFHFIPLRSDKERSRFSTVFGNLAELWGQPLRFRTATFKEQNGTLEKAQIFSFINNIFNGSSISCSCMTMMMKMTKTREITHINADINTLSIKQVNFAHNTFP